MKVLRKSLFRILFFVALLCCLGIDMYSNYHTYNMEVSGEHNKSRNSLAKDIDSHSHDQISNKYRFCFVAEPTALIPLSQNPFTASDFSVSIWQPPKI